MRRSLSAPIAHDKKDLKGRIFDIQSFSVHDGPGCRTLVFMSGCPLRCSWCCNPESFYNRQGKLYMGSKCINTASKPCTRCTNACPYGAVHDNSQDPEHPMKFDWELCHTCTTLECIDACFDDALVRISKEYTVEEIMYILERDRHYWSGNGGVTFSGGDPMFQPEFLEAVLARCDELYIHKAIETEALADTSIYLRIMRYMDFAFNDLKCMDSELHRTYTGVGNERILNNIRAFASSGNHTRLILRAPVIPGFNDSEENFSRVADFMNEIGLDEFNLLPFHRLGVSKWEELSMEYAFKNEQPTSPHTLAKLQKVLLDRNIKCYLGSNTPF